MQLFVLLFDQMKNKSNCQASCQFGVCVYLSNDTLTHPLLHALYEKKRAKHIIIISINTLLEAIPIISTLHFINCSILLCCLLFVVSSALSTTPSPTIQSAANNTTPENVPPTTRTTGARSTEKPMIIHSTTGKYNYRAFSHDVTAANWCS